MIDFDEQTRLLVEELRRPHSFVRMPEDLLQAWNELPRENPVRLPRAAVECLFASMEAVAKNSYLMSLAITGLAPSSPVFLQMAESSKQLRRSINQITGFMAILAADATGKQLPETFLNETAEAAKQGEW